MSSNMMWTCPAGSQGPALSLPFLSCMSFPQPHSLTPCIPCLTSAVSSEAHRGLSDLFHDSAGSLLAMAPILKWPICKVTFQPVGCRIIWGPLFRALNYQAPWDNLDRERHQVPRWGQPTPSGQSLVPFPFQRGSPGYG